MGLNINVADVVCAVIYCGQGVCKASNDSLLGFDCECNPGWKKIQIGPLTFPSCLLPNCESLPYNNPTLLLKIRESAPPYVLMHLDKFD